MGTIHLKNIKFYAYHGCLGEEKKIGADYLVNLKVSANLDKASKSDNLVDAVDYVLLNEIVSSEMKTAQLIYRMASQGSASQYNHVACAALPARRRRGRGRASNSFCTLGRRW